MDAIVPGRPLLATYLRRPALTGLLACAFAVSPATSALSAITCKPMLSIKNVREIRTASASIQPWIWKATIVADPSFCATAAGSFEIDFIQITEYSPDVQFTEKYRWASGQFDVTVELGAGESIHDYRIGFVAPCVCREFPLD